MQMQRLYDAGTEINQTALRVNPNLPLQSSLPSSQGIHQSPLGNGLARSTSKKRRPSGTGSGRIPIDSFPQPPAPEVPKAPPMSYRPPYNAETYSPLEGNDPASFAERARALSGNSIPPEPQDLTPKPPPPRARPERRSSLNRPIGGLYAEIQKHKRDSYPPQSGPASPRRFSNPASPRQSEPGSGNPSSQKGSPATAQQYDDPSDTPHQRVGSATGREHPKTASPKTKSHARRASTTVTQSPTKEWAPERSPLQKLEVELTSKEKKRARMEAAEQKLRESQARDRQHDLGQKGDLTTDRNQSRRVSNHSGATDTPRLSEQTKAPGPDRHRQHPARESKSQRRSGRIYSDSYQPLSPGFPDENPTRSTEKSQLDQQQGRGVRFEGEEDTEDLGAYSSDMDKADSQIGRRSWGTDALAKSDEARAALRDQHRQKSVTVGRHASRHVPRQQQELYANRSEKMGEDVSAATHGGALDPVSRHNVQGQSETTKPAPSLQTAAGIQARQMVGFDNAPQEAVERHADRGHHLSKFLHRSHNHTSSAFEQPNAGPTILDEWKHGGTARLTTADFVNSNESNEKGKAWWEDRRSDSRRKLGRAKQPQSLQDDYQDNKGKRPDSVHNQTTPAASFSTKPVILTRQYVSQEQFQRLKSGSGSPGDGHLSHLLHRGRKEQLSNLSSVYSYSCTNLADHDPAHFEHICEPYLSKELTLSMRSIRIRPAPALATFDPPLYLKCGPLLRYTGLKRDRLQTQTRSGPSSSERETWRGSVMIVTADADSSYDPAPTLRLFPEAMDLLPPPPQHVNSEDGHELPAEYIDPIAGLPKLSRSGKTVYVKPVDDLEQGVDLSRLENDDGLFEEFRTAVVPTAYGTPDFHPGRNNGTSQPHSKTGGRGERAAKRGQQVRGVRLHAERGVTFWRFNLEVELSVQQTRVAYSINGSPSVGFWIPGRGQSMNAMFHSCNGFSMSVK